MNDLYNELLKSKKYSDIAPAVLQRVCENASMRYSKPKDALKAAKTELHIINESYLTSDCHKKAAALISGYSGSGMATDKEFSLSLMRLHASSRERIEYINEIYSFLSCFVNRNTVLGDIGCGFSPFALPFFDKAPQKYFAYEINGETTGVLNRYFSAMSKNGYFAETLDAVSVVPEKHFDTVFLFKLLPVLQQQKKGRAFEVLMELDYSVGVVSFPLKSLSGREKGMNGHYSSFFEDGLPTGFKVMDKQSIGNELFYIIKKHTAG